MTTPAVRITKTDGGIGPSANTDRILALIGPSTAGIANAPQAFTSSADAAAQFGSGPLVEDAAYLLDLGVPVVMIRAAAPNVGSYGALLKSIEGTADVDVSSGSEPVDNYDVRVEVLRGGTVGTAGITYRYSLDDGVSWSGAQSLATADVIQLPGGVSFDLGAGDLEAGDSWSVPTFEPSISSASLAPALDALYEYDGDWLRVLVHAEADQTMLGQLDAEARRYHPLGKYPEFIVNTRVRDVFRQLGTLTVTKTGTSAVSIAPESEPTGAGLLQVKVTTAGTIGVAGIFTSYSLDGGATWSTPAALGTATELAIPGTGITFDLGAGTLALNDTWQVPYGAESRSEYLAALASDTDVQSLEVSPAADQGEVVSALTGYRQRRLAALPYAARLMLIDDSVDAAEVSLGALPGFFIRSADGSRVYHDELLYPGVDALGVTAMRSFRGRPRRKGAYVNNPRLLSGAGSDYRYFQLSAIVNRAIETTFSQLEPKLSKGVLLNESGTIREDVAAAIEGTVDAELRTIYATPGRVSAVRMRLSRTDNVLSTDTISFTVEVQPLGYAKFFAGKVGLVRAISTTKLAA